MTANFFYLDMGLNCNLSRDVLMGQDNSDHEKLEVAYCNNELALDNQNRMTDYMMKIRPMCSILHQLNKQHFLETNNCTFYSTNSIL